MNNQKRPRQWKSISFKIALVIVVALHVVVFVLLGFSGKKKTKSKELLAQEEHDRKAFVARYYKPQTNAKPRVVSKSPVKVPKPTPTPTPKYSSSKQTMIAKTVPRKELPKPIPSSPVTDWQSIVEHSAAPTLPRIDVALTKPKTYVLASGDNLYAVCKRLNVSFNDLVAVNNIKDVRDLYAGLALKIP